MLLFREAASFVSHRLEEAGLSWRDPAYDAAVRAFNGGDRQESLNAAWSEADPEAVKHVLRLCARSSVRAISSPPRNPSYGRPAEDQHHGASPPEHRQRLDASPSVKGRQAEHGDEVSPQLPSNAT